MRIDQITSGFSTGDAISGEIVQYQKLFHRWGYKSEIFVDTRFTSPKMRGMCRDFRLYPEIDDPSNIVIFHFSIGSQVSLLLKQIRARKIMKYHNITPAEFFESVDRATADSLRRGREELRSFKDIVDLALGDSEYNRRELDEMGYPQTGSVPILMDFADLERQPDSKVLQLNTASFTNVLFVGRVVPNKKFEDVIRCFYFYQKTCNTASRLFLVGSYHGLPNYYIYLKALVNELQLQGVYFAGHVSDAELAAYYQLADLFLCMSEHEGFCIPLVEAMYHKIPVLAYKAAAVGETLNDAGIICNDKQFDQIAEAMHILMENKDLREKVIAGQLNRVQEFNPQKTELKLRAYLEPWLRQDREP